MRQIVEFRNRRDTALTWAVKNPILEAGEHGFELDTGKFKIGNGVKRWLDLRYFLPEDDSVPTGPSSEELVNHINDENPHPVYDDGASFLLLYQNAKV